MMTDNDVKLLNELRRIANEKFDGHFTVMKFTTNWRVGFGTVNERFEIEALPAGETFAQAAIKALNTLASVYDVHDDDNPFCRSASELSPDSA